LNSLTLERRASNGKLKEVRKEVERASSKDYGGALTAVPALGEKEKEGISNRRAV